MAPSRLKIRAQAKRIDSVESIHGLLISLKIPSRLDMCMGMVGLGRERSYDCVSEEEWTLQERMGKKDIKEKEFSS